MTANHFLSMMPRSAGQELRQLDTLTGHRTFAPGELIFSKGEVAAEFFVIIQGEVEIFQPDQGDAIIARLDSGQYFGELGLMRGSPRMASVRAAPDLSEPVIVAAISREKFSHLLSESRLSQRDIAEVMSRRLGAL
jgi:CRP-like cAMP-binding protein